MPQSHLQSFAQTTRDEILTQAERSQFLTAQKVSARKDNPNQMEDGERRQWYSYFTQSNQSDYSKLTKEPNLQQMRDSAAKSVC